MAWAVNYRRLAAEAQVRAQLVHVGIVIDEVALLQVFLRVFSLLPCQYHSTVTVHAHTLSGWWTMDPLVATVQRHSLTPSTWTNKSMEQSSYWETIAQVVKKFHPFCGTWRFITPSHAVFFKISFSSILPGPISPISDFTAEMLCYEFLISPCVLQFFLVSSSLVWSS
jgi:hypothetical protein